MKKKIRILQVCSVGFTAKTLILPLINKLKDKYDVTIACSKDEISEELKENGYNVHYINLGREIQPVKNILTIVELYRFFKKEKYDIVHFHTPLAGMLGRIAAKMARVPIVLFTARGFYFHENMSFIKRCVFMAVERLGGWLSDYVFIQSSEDYNIAIEKKIINQKKILRIGNGINLTRFNKNRVDNVSTEEIKRQFNIKNNDTVIGIIGRVVREKGYVEWVKAAEVVLKKHENVKFMAIGDTLSTDRDKVKPELDEIIKDNDMSNNVIFTGIRYDIPELLSAIDIFTLPSYREGMPRSIMEAMSMSIPVIATNIRGCREEVLEGKTGYLVPAGEHDMLAEKILLLIENPDLRRAFGEKARIRAEEDFNEDTILEKQLRVIEELITKKINKR